MKSCPGIGAARIFLSTFRPRPGVGIDKAAGVRAGAGRGAGTQGAPHRSGRRPGDRARRWPGPQPGHVRVDTARHAQQGRYRTGRARGFERVRAMTDENGRPVKSAGRRSRSRCRDSRACRTPATKWWWSSERKAREIALYKSGSKIQGYTVGGPFPKLTNVFEQMQEPGTRPRRSTLSSRPTSGSVEALTTALETFPPTRSGRGHSRHGHGIAESDVNLAAAASKAIILGFNIARRRRHIDA